MQEPFLHAAAFFPTTGDHIYRLEQQFYIISNICFKNAEVVKNVRTNVVKIPLSGHGRSFCGALWSRHKKFWKKMVKRG